MFLTPPWKILSSPGKKSADAHGYDDILLSLFYFVLCAQVPKEIKQNTVLPLVFFYIPLKIQNKVEKEDHHQSGFFFSGDLF